MDKKLKFRSGHHFLTESEMQTLYELTLQLFHSAQIDPDGFVQVPAIIKVDRQSYNDLITLNLKTTPTPDVNY